MCPGEYGEAAFVASLLQVCQASIGIADLYFRIFHFIRVRRAGVGVARRE